jgi:hypothetical protein
MLGGVTRCGRISSPSARTRRSGTAQLLVRGTCAIDVVHETLTCHHPDVGLDGGEGIVGGLGQCAAVQCVEEQRLARIRHAHNAALAIHARTAGVKGADLRSGREL